MERKCSSNNRFFSKQSVKPLHEGYLLQQIPTHRGIIQLIELVIASDTISLVTRHAGTTNLKLYLDNEGPFHQSEAVRFFFPLCKAVQHLHHHGIVHLSIRPENIIVTDNLEPILCDFAFAFPIEKKKSFKYYVDELKARPNDPFIAPEIFAKRPEIGFPNDIWSLGIILYSILFGTLNSSSNIASILSNLKGSEDLDSLFSMILCSKFSKRPSIETLLQQPWFHQILQEFPGVLTDQPKKSRISVLMSRKNKKRSEEPMEEQQQSRPQKDEISQDSIILEPIVESLTKSASLGSFISKENEEAKKPDQSSDPQLPVSTSNEPEDLLARRSSIKIEFQLSTKTQLISSSSLTNSLSVSKQLSHIDRQTASDSQSSEVALLLKHFNSEEKSRTLR
eukprot:TRINITY_DN4581_c0_g1_i1.p1 TRINITY_DN4581_c0_g1~~TRINITY_DN4581_c0_g1_i1.p1  ORF type:complete len:394 (-),score=63.29 TRINITY_DN4581_c0_g1_i1:5-1186(-)